MDILWKYLVLLLVITDLKHVHSDEVKLNYLCNQKGPDERIVGGSKVPVDKYKFMAALVVKKNAVLAADSLQCGCAIITTVLIITAAHCLALLKQQNFGPKDVYVSSGHIEWRKGFKHDVLKMIAHELYSESTMDWDAGLIRVDQPFVKEPEVRIALASAHYPYEAGALVTVMGWGLHSESAIAQQPSLEEVNVTIINHATCRAMYAKQHEVLMNSQFCAGSDKGGKDACQFDSGGPIIDGFILIGIVSWGIGCGHHESPGVYTKVGVLEKWIIETAQKMNTSVVTTCGIRRTDKFNHSIHTSSSVCLKYVLKFHILYVLLIYAFK